MSNPTTHLPAVQEALSGFLGTLLGTEVPLNIDAPVEAQLADVRLQSAAYLTVVSTSGPEDGFAVLLDGSWLARLSKAMLGEALSPGDEGVEDLIGEVAAQGYGTVRNQMGAEGLVLPEVSFEVLSPGMQLPKGVLADTLFELSFSVELDGETLGGMAVLPAPESSAKPAASLGAGGPSATESRRPVEVKPAAFPDLGFSEAATDVLSGNFNLLAEVELEVAVELGRRKIPLSDLLRLTNGSVIELEKLVGEPLEVYANGRLIAEGEAVVIDEQFGIRITNLATAKNRARALYT